MNDMNRFAAMWVLVLALGGVAACGAHISAHAAPEAPAKTSTNLRLLMQSKANPSKWEALEVLAADPSNFYRTELSTAQARRWMAEGGFQHVSNQRYNAELRAAAAVKYATPAPPFGSRLSAAAVARMNQRAGRTTGPAVMAEMFSDRALLASR